MTNRLAQPLTNGLAATKRRGNRMKSLNIGVIGAGLMGHGIAYLLAAAGHTVRVYDPSAEWRKTMPERLESAALITIPWHTTSAGSGPISTSDSAAATRSS